MPDMAEAVHVIYSKEEFLAELRVGDEFWYMSSRHFRPYATEGPFKILDFVTLGREKFLNVKCRIARKYVQAIEYYSINDLTNEHHGVFTDEGEARKYFKEKRAAFDRINAPAKR